MEGAYFHWVDENGNERRFYGVDYGSKSGDTGSIWIENGYFTYLDGNGRKRVIK